MMATRSTNRSHRRNAFTMIELLVVISIIGILMAFLLPAISGVRKNARIAQVRAEISALESGIVSFKQKYGVDPPSRIVLYEKGTSSSPPTPNWNTDADSRGKIRQIWPQFDFATTNRDLNGDGDTDDSFALTQGECLVFFLGGMLIRPEDTNANGTLDSGEVDLDGDSRLGAIVTSNGTKLRPSCTGFSKNPLNAFALGGSRDTAVYEFDVGRLVDSAELGLPNGDGFPEFVDPLTSQTSPYLYFSSYEGQGYRSNSASATFEFATAVQAAAEPYPPTGPYLQSATSPWKPKSFQIVSPGFDKYYGPFGVWTAETADSVLVKSAGSQRQYEVDNITNFHNSTLGR